MSHRTAFFISSSTFGALYGHAMAHVPHPMHFSGSIKTQVGFIKYQHGSNIFFPHLNHKALGTTDIEIIIQTLHDKGFVNMSRYSLFFGNRSGFPTTQST